MDSHAYKVKERMVSIAGPREKLPNSGKGDHWLV
jgi:hypothetical protein